jgi:hypothetical protein
MYPSAMEEYRSKYGEYIAHEDTITFEWRWLNVKNKSGPNRFIGPSTIFRNRCRL